MKKIINRTEVMNYFVHQIEGFYNKCLATAQKQLDEMKSRKDPKLSLFGEEACLKRLTNNLFYNDNKAVFVHYSDDTVQLYIGNRNEPSVNAIEIDHWQFVGDVDEDELFETMADNIIEEYNFLLKYNQ